MKKISLLEFQQEAVDKGIKCLLNKKTYFFQSPTGTGKTFISANLINKFIENIPVDEKYTFLHFSPSTGQLNEQNAEKFEQYRKTSGLTRYETWLLTSTKQITINSFEKNIIHFFGWDSLIKKTNTIVSEMERNNWFDVLVKTFNKDIKIVMIIDEQHINKNSKATSLFIEKIIELHKLFFNENPIRIETSATIAKNDIGKLNHRVYYSQAKEEELVKKGILINKDLTDGVMTENEVLIHSAINKREEIIGVYNKKNLMKKGKLPLLVIQLPDSDKTKGDITQTVEATIKYVLSHHKMHKNHVAIWISGKHETLDGKKIEKIDVENNEDISVLIFKQAIAVGWDIPRANIWVKLRNNMDKAFETQTLGRVLRNQFRKYYNNELIDNAFIYTNDQNIKSEIEETYGENVSSIEKMKVFKHENITDYEKEDKLAIINYKERELDVDLIFDNLLNKVRKSSEISIVKYEIFNKIELENWTTKLKLGGYIPEADNVQNIKTYIQTTLGDEYELTLYKRWFEFKNSLDNELVQKVLEIIIDEFAMKNPKLRITSRAYKYFYDNNGSSQQLINLIKSLFREISVNEKNYTSSAFVLKKQIDIFNKYVDFENVVKEKFDENMFYKTSLKINKKENDGFDSNVERRFYKELLNPLSEIIERNKLKYFIYNQVDANQFYYISYVDKNFKVRKYFPDFIIVTEKTIFILDTKTYDGINVSYKETSEHKMDVVNDFLNLKKIQQYTKKEVKFGYVYEHNSNWYVVSKTKTENENFNSESINDFMKE